MGDPARGVGILNNPLYKGQVVWGRSKWTRSAANSNDRKVEAVDATEWVVAKDESLRIVPDDLWDKVRAVQIATNPRREAVRKGIAKKASGHGSKYWLGTLLVCGECGSNYIGDGRRDYVCPAHTAGHCSNDLRFRRDDAHIAVFDLLREKVLSEAAIARGKKYVESVLKEREQQEHAAVKDAASGVDVSRLDKEAAELRAMGLRPAALAAGLAEIEEERAELLAKAAGKRDQKDGRARQLLARMPDLVRGYRAPRCNVQSRCWRSRKRWKTVVSRCGDCLRMGESHWRQIPRTQRSQDRCI